MKLFFLPLFTKNAIAVKVLCLYWSYLVKLNLDIDQAYMQNLVTIYAKIHEPPIAKIDAF